MVFTILLCGLQYVQYTREFVRNKIDLNELFMKKSKNKIICCSLISMLLVVVMNIFNLNKKSIFNNCKDSTDVVRQNIIYALIITFVDIAICYYVYKFLCKYIPWSVGKGKLRCDKN